MNALHLLNLALLLLGKGVVIAAIAWAVCALRDRRCAKCRRRHRKLRR